MNTFSISSAFSRAWEIYKTHWQVILPIAIVYALVNMVFSALDPESKNIIIQIAAFLVNTLLTLGVIVIAQKLLRNEKVEIKEIFTHTEHYLLAVIASIVMGVVVIAGFILLIIPGIFLSVRLNFLMTELVNSHKDVQFADLFKNAWQLTKGHFWFTLGLLVVLILFNILGLVALLVGVFVTAPMSVLIYIMYYQYLKGGTDAAPTMPTAATPEAPTPSQPEAVAPTMPAEPVAMETPAASMPETPMQPAATPQEPQPIAMPQEEKTPETTSAPS